MLVSVFFRRLLKESKIIQLSESIKTLDQTFLPTFYKRRQSSLDFILIVVSSKTENWKLKTWPKLNFDGFSIFVQCKVIKSSPYNQDILFEYLNKLRYKKFDSYCLVYVFMLIKIEIA